MEYTYPDEGRSARKPPDGWGTGTKQAHPGYPDPDSPGSGWNNRATDADQMRRCFGISPYSDEWPPYQHPYPNCLNHTEDGGEWGHVGGTNWLGVGGKGAGKSTFGLYWAVRLMEVNNEAVLWRGVSNRSEWLPLAPWTTVYLPRSVDLDPRWMPEDMKRPNGGEPANLEEIVREVRYYDNPVDLNDQLEPGTFNVAYPDPEFTDCEDIMRSSDYVGTNVTFTPLSEADENEGTSVEHWWFAYFVARWRVDFPDESGNRTADEEPPLGFKEIPMEANMLQSKDAGHLIMWQSSNFTPFRSDDIPEPEEFDGRWLKISQNEGSTRARFSTRRRETGEVADD